MHGFQARETARLANSGWTTVDPLPSPRGSLSRRQWTHAAEVADQLTRHFADARFAADVEFGLLYVPAVDTLDTRSALPVALRRTQDRALTDDFVDQRLGAGVDLVTAGWAVFVTVVGRYGISAGSYQDVVAAQTFHVDGVDTRIGMTRQLWGARVLQAGTAFLPDCERNERWTFTLFPGEPTTDGQAPSGTVLKGKVRHRLGKPDRGIGSARVAPAVLVAELG